MLVAMATGTGKTFTIVNQIYRLMKSGVAKRILFLVDRRALAAQAVRAFAASSRAGPEVRQDLRGLQSSASRGRTSARTRRSTRRSCPSGYLTDPQPRPRLRLRLHDPADGRSTSSAARRSSDPASEETIDDDADRLDIPIHAFDLIIADECHRGYTSQELSVWRKTLDHFDAIKIGLTATPAAHTTAYFNDVVFRYEYDQAVREGYLVDYDVVNVQFRRPHERRLPPGGRAASSMVDPETGRKRLDQLEDEREFDTTEIERKVTAPDSNRKILEELKKYADEHEQRYGRFPKTLDLRRQRPPAHVPRRPARGHWRATSSAGATPSSRRSPGRVDRPLQRIREFRNRPQPGDRRHGRPAHHRRRHPRPRVHRLPPAGEDPHPLRADARPRHAQGRAVPRQDPLHRLRLLRRHAARVLPRRHGHHRRAARPARRGPSTRSSRTSGRTGTATTTSAAWSSGSSASTRRCPARPASCSPPTSPTATSAASPADLPSSPAPRTSPAR